MMSVQVPPKGSGTLYGVGVGPGAPDLLTTRAAQVLQQCPVVCLPASTRGGSYAGRIVEHLVDPARQEMLTVRFPMLKDKAQALLAREAAANEVLDRLQAGRDVAFVTEGDPLVYSTFGYLLEAVRRRDAAIPIAVIPGVSSITAAAGAACLPLAAWDERIAIIPATYALGREEPAHVRNLLPLFHTIILLKVSSVFDALLDVLVEVGLLQHAVFVQRCGTEQEKVIWDLARLRGQSIDYFSLVIVRNPHAIGT
jgi:precorrin-2/cobalt-factor-2 C20-methyltransferase